MVGIYTVGIEGVGDGVGGNDLPEGDGVGNGLGDQIVGI
jgi:hypothetical protein